MAKKKIQAECKIDQDDYPTLESILSKIDALSPDTPSFDLLIPDRMTFRGRPIWREFQAVILDRLLSKGLVPVERKERAKGKFFKFGRVTIDPSTLRTEPPPIDPVERVPALGPLAKNTTRLHPRRAFFPDLAASKLGGTFLWPRSEPWPRCDDPRHQTIRRQRRLLTDGICPLLVGVVQLNARDFPEIPFRRGADLLQLLWCPAPEAVHDDAYFPKLFAYWRNSKKVNDPLSAHPLPDYVDGMFNYFPVSCQFFPETVKEFPGPAALYELPEDNEIHKVRETDEDFWSLYQFELSTCPGTKLGGHPCWSQGDDAPVCDCGREMEFLLQLFDWEYTNTDDHQRWIPLADRWALKKWRKNPAAEAALRPPYFEFGHTAYYFFICPKCRERPVRFVHQR
jgi:hypothetical protein